MQTEPVTLETPLQRGDQSISEVSIKKPAGTSWLRGVSLFELARLDANALCTVLPRVTEPALTQAEINAKLSPSDLFRLGTEVAALLLPDSTFPPLANDVG